MPETRSKAGSDGSRLARRLVAWWFPLGIAWFGYNLGFFKLTMLNETGLKIVKWDDPTAYAVDVIIWIFQNSWVWAGCALTLAALCFLLPSRRPVGHCRAAVLLIAYTAATCILLAGAHLMRKVVG